MTDLAPRLGSFAPLALVLACGLAGLATAAPERVGATSKLEAEPLLVMPGPARGVRAEDRLDLNDDCVACHADIASEWSHSLHRQSFSDPMFQQALAREEDPAFCRSCHAPEADPKRSPTKREAQAGVACVSCHLAGAGNEILAGPTAKGRAPHRLRRSQEFASPRACGRCHEFWFPGAGRGGEDLKMQRTLAEHARSNFADEPCQSCHMSPARSEGAVHRGHRFAVVGQPDTLRAAIDITADRPAPGRALIELAPRLIGHAFPTGDLFRRVAVEVRVGDWSATHYLARHFGVRRVGPEGNVVKVERRDDRVGIGGDPRRIEFEIPSHLDHLPLTWTIVYERVLEAAAGAERRADIWDRTVLESGSLEPPK